MNNYPEVIANVGFDGIGKLLVLDVDFKTNWVVDVMLEESAVFAKPHRCLVDVVVHILQGL